MAISDSTLTADIFDSIRTKLVAANLAITDGAVYPASIGASFNDKNPSRPQIIITPVTYDEGTYKFSSKQGKKSVNVVVEVFYSNTLGIDVLSDRVVDIIKDNDIDGLNLVGVASDYAFNSPGDNKWHLKTLTFGFDRE